MDNTNMKEKLYRVGNHKLCTLAWGIVGNHKLCTLAWGIIGLCCSGAAPSYLMINQGSKSVVKTTVCVLVFVNLFYLGGYAARDTYFMRKGMMAYKYGWVGNSGMNYVVSGIVVFAAVKHEITINMVYGQLLMCMGVFGLVELSKPVTDFGLLQVSLRLPVQTAAVLVHKGVANWHVLLLSSLVLFFCTLWQSVYLHSYDRPVVIQGAGPAQNQAPVLPLVDNGSEGGDQVPPPAA